MHTDERRITTKTKEELNALKEEVETMSGKLSELTKEELEQVAGGGEPGPCCYITQMECQTQFCFHDETRYGHYLNQFFDCPSCGNHTLKGTKIIYTG